MRTCPCCTDQALGEYWTQSQMIDRCAKCGGQFYDHGELESIIKMVQTLQQIELDEPDIETLDPRTRSRYVCPADGEEMKRKDYGGVAVDACLKCRGIWLDKGEIIEKGTHETLLKNRNFYYYLWKIQAGENNI